MMIKSYRTGIVWKDQMDKNKQIFSIFDYSIKYFFYFLKKCFIDLKNKKIKSNLSEIISDGLK